MWGLILLILTQREDINKTFPGHGARRLRWGHREPTAGHAVIIAGTIIMSDDTDHDPYERREDTKPGGLGRSDLVAVLAVTSFLAAIGLTTFYLTTALAH